MRTVTFTLRGTPAVVALLLVLGFFGIRVAFRQSTLNTRGREAVRSYLQSQYIREVLATLPNSRPVSEADGERLQRAQRIEVRSAVVRGWGRSRIVRAEVTTDGRQPPNGRGVRYLRVRNAWPDQWYVTGETSAVLYALKF
jgi:hypothetical protein